MIMIPKASIMNIPIFKKNLKKKKKALKKKKNQNNKKN